MQNLSVNYYQRIILWTQLGAHQVTNLKEASTYLRLIEKIRLTDEEMLKTQFVQDQGKMSWQLPEPGYGNLVLDLEHEEAKSLVSAMEAPTQGLRVSDAQWMLKMVEELNAGQPAQPNATVAKEA